MVSTSTRSLLKTAAFRFTLKLAISIFILSNICSLVAAQPSKSILFTQTSQTVEVEQGSSQSLLEYISTTDNAPVQVKLQALDEAGKIPDWLSVNGAILNDAGYTAGSE